MTLVLRLLGEDDREQAAALGSLAFGGDPQAPLPPVQPGRLAWGVFDAGRLVAKAVLRDDAQWWGGREVRAGGVAGVAVHPGWRGRGLAGRLLRALLAHLRADGVPLSLLFPTAPGIYRRLGWEVAGVLSETLVPTAALAPPRTAALAPPGAADGDDVALRAAGAADVSALTALWQAHGRVVDGVLTRTAPCWPEGLAVVLEDDVVLLAERDGEAVGYASHDRGRGYGPGSEIALGDLVATTPAAADALLRALGSWDAVAPTLRWRGSVAALQHRLPAALPPPVRAQPWMLRVVDAPGAVAARGYPPGLRLQAVFTLVDPLVPEHEGAWELVVRDGGGELRRVAAPGPRLHVRGLALLLAGCADTASLRRAGLLDGDLAAGGSAGGDGSLDGLVGRPPELVDYF